MIERFSNSPNRVRVQLLISFTMVIFVIFCCGPCLWFERELQCGRMSIFDSHLSSDLCDENGVCYEPRGPLYKLHLCGEPAITHTESPQMP